MSRGGVNLGFYDSPYASTHYGGRSGLLVAEILIFFKYHDEIVGSRFLDVGCGAGRTTLFLCRWCGKYVGIDYSDAMVRACSAAHGDCCCDVADARDLSAYGDGDFDIVFFSHNGLDALTHDDRLVALSEFRRVLRPGGLLIFSTHNRDYTFARSEPKLVWTFDPWALLKRLEQHRRALRNRRRNRKHERFEDAYWILNDRAHNYSLLTYYISHPTQRAQLSETGFETLDVYTRDGDVLEEDAVRDDTPWLYFVARRAA